MFRWTGAALRVIVVGVLLAVLAMACAGSPASADPVASCGASTLATLTAVDAKVANNIDGGELAGSETQVDLRHVTGAADLLSAVAAGNRAATQKAVSRIVYHHFWHIVRLRALDTSGRSPGGRRRPVRDRAGAGRPVRRRARDRQLRHVGAGRHGVRQARAPRDRRSDRDLCERQARGRAGRVLPLPTAARATAEPRRDQLCRAAADLQSLPRGPAERGDRRATAVGGADRGSRARRSWSARSGAWRSASRRGSTRSWPATPASSRPAMPTPARSSWCASGCARSAAATVPDRRSCRRAARSATCRRTGRCSRSRRLRRRGSTC